MLFTLGRVLEIMSLRKQYQHIRYSREWKCNAWKKYNARDKHHKDVKNKEDRFRVFDYDQLRKVGDRWDEKNSESYFEK